MHTQRTAKPSHYSQPTRTHPSADTPVHLPQPRPAVNTSRYTQTAHTHSPPPPKYKAHSIVRVDAFCPRPQFQRTVNPSRPPQPAHTHTRPSYALETQAYNLSQYPRHAHFRPSSAFEREARNAGRGNTSYQQKGTVASHTKKAFRYGELTYNQPTLDASSRRGRRGQVRCSVNTFEQAQPVYVMPSKYQPTRYGMASAYHHQ
ncbi:hypothetical protein PENSPDRAFT_301691 [Peniophora sp. CONT]|nr:hypothetical protein PENSPDRAFT_301691 [Peniophora sp. CONT]